MSRVLGTLLLAGERFDRCVLATVVASTTEEAVAALRDAWEEQQGTAMGEQLLWQEAERQIRTGEARHGRLEAYLVPLPPRGSPPAPRPMGRRPSPHPAQPFPVTRR